MLKLDEFIVDALHSQPYKFNHIEVDQLVTWENTNTLLSSGVLDYPRIRIACAENEYSKSYSGFLRYAYSDRGEKLAKIIPGVLYKNLALGGTIIIDRCEAFFPTVNTLVKEISEMLGCRSWANLYISAKGSSGFSCHFDDHDILAIQIYGTKQWTIHEPTYQSPNRGDKSFHLPPPRGKPLKIEILPSGGGIYLPSGYWHNVETLSDLSLHVTIGMDFTRRLDVMRLIANELAANSFFRGRLEAHDGNELKQRLIEAIENLDAKLLTSKIFEQANIGEHELKLPNYWSKSI
ncbi:Cupin superfamily protein [Pseudomonas flavescens]|uniref:Cupin superfamily protein n=1 Tax=Phytopseudomonas flavescens TaxID=29435 RepID=A0A1G8H1G3_9GAMM|nr:cupin domain-containing protein [Pseudomonas flavescens]SDI00454.1 Cupin superfamily protein [Pseudomonas flavescens]